MERSIGPSHLLKPVSQRIRQVFAGWALEAVLAAARRPPSNEDSLADGASLGGLRRSFVTHQPFLVVRSSVAIRASSSKQIETLIADLRAGRAVTRDAAVARLTVIGSRAVEPL